MAPRRSVKSGSATNNNNYNNLTLSDALCPICRSILIQPVTLPCNHGFCSSCFEGTVANANLVCPLCRVRIGSWLRTSKKDNGLVNSILWEAVQRIFPEEVKKKLAGVEEYPQEDIPRRLTAPGEIRREYETQKAKEELELHKQHEAEAKASEAYIKKLREQEDYEETVREENLRLSEQVAKKLAQEYCFDPGPSSSKSNGPPPSSSKKQGPIDRLLKNMSQKKLTVTLQPGSETIKKEYTCKILCQDKSKEIVNSSLPDKAALINWKIQDKLRKIVTEGEASDSNDSIDSECRYFKPIEQRYIPLSRKVPIIKVPALIRTANTVIIGPPKGQTKFTHAALGSAFAVVQFIALPLNISEEKNTMVKSKGLDQKKPLSCDTTITELLPIETFVKNMEIQSPKKQTRNNRQTADILYTPTSGVKRYGMSNRSSEKVLPKGDEKTPDKILNPSSLVSYNTLSKRKRLRSTPTEEDHSCVKRTRISDSVVSPPFYGFDNRNLNELKANTNGAIMLESTNLNNINSKLNNSNNKNMKKLQEEEDLKFARMLHEELNYRGRYSKRNSISVQVKNGKKPATRQVTLKEIISQTVSKIP